MADSWARRRVLVTGASGVIGSWLVKELLAAGAEVVALVPELEPGSELARSGDIDRVARVGGWLEDLGTLARTIGSHEIDTVFHLGAQTLVVPAQRNPLPTWEANVRGTYNLLEACRLHSGLVERVVVASSDKAYGAADELPYTESSRLEARNPYEVSKACADLIAHSYAHAYSIPVAVARCGNVYGGGDLNWSRLVPGTIRSFLAGERPQIRSDGTHVRDYLYVKDAARSYLALADRLDDERVRGQAFNFGTGVPHTVLEVVQMLRDRMGCDGLEPEILASAEGEIETQVLSFEKASTLLGWQPQYRLEDGLPETIDWYRAYLS
jgi:CDP-glucose 4,6-dehydratase